jgi:hypothetical protein
VAESFDWFLEGRLEPSTAATGPLNCNLVKLEMAPDSQHLLF